MFDVIIKIGGMLTYYFWKYNWENSNRIAVLYFEVRIWMHVKCGYSFLFSNQ